MIMSLCTACIAPRMAKMGSCPGRQRTPSRRLARRGRARARMSRRGRGTRRGRCSPSRRRGLHSRGAPGPQARKAVRYVVTSWPMRFSTWCSARHLWRSISRRRTAVVEV
jgi:hypothetical protein